MMLRRFSIWITVGAFVVMVEAGCRTAPSHDPSSQPDHHHAKRLPPSDSALESEADAHAHYAAGVILEVDEQPEAALKEYSLAALKDPENEALVLEVSRRFLQNKQPEKALEVLSRAAARPNASAAVLARLGFVYSQLGKPDQAVTASRAAVRKAPGSLIGYQNLFVIYLQSKQPQEALKVLDEAGRQPRLDADFLIGLAELYANLGLQVPALRKAANAQALVVLNRAEALHPANPGLRLKLADDYNLVGESTRSAEIYKDLLKTAPELPVVRDRVRARLADIYLRSSDHKAAAEQLEGILADDPTNAQACYSLATLALDDKQFEKAEGYLEKALLLNPDLSPAYYDLARTQIALKKISAALATLERARAKFPRNFALEYLSGIAFSQQKAYPEAVQHYTAAEVIAQATEPKWLDESFYFQLGAAYERKGDFEEAETTFEKCLELAPDFAEALNYLGYMWAEKGQHLDRAREMIEKALKLEPKNAAYLDSLGWVLFKLKQPTQALDYLLQAAALTDPPDATIYEHLGDTYAALGQADKARDAWQKSLSVEPNDQVRKKIDELKP